MSRPGLALLPQGRYASRKAAGTRLWRSPEGLDCHRQRARQALGRDNPNDGPTGTAGKARTGGKPGRQSGAWKARTPCKPGRQARTPDNPERRTNRNGRETPNGSQAARQAGRQPGRQAARQPGRQAARQPGSQAARQAGRQSRTESTLNPQPNPKNTAQPEEQRSNQPQPESTPTQPEDHRPTHNQPQQRPQNPRPPSTKQAHSPHYPNPSPHPPHPPPPPPAPRPAQSNPATTHLTPAASIPRNSFLRSAISSRNRAANSNCRSRAAFIIWSVNCCTRSASSEGAMDTKFSLTYTPEDRPPGSPAARRPREAFRPEPPIGTSVPASPASL